MKELERQRTVIIETAALYSQVKALPGLTLDETKAQVMARGASHYGPGAEANGFELAVEQEATRLYHRAWRSKKRAPLDIAA